MANDQGFGEINPGQVPSGDSAVKPQQETVAVDPAKEQELKAAERRKRLAADLAKGLEIGKGIIGEGSLGRQTVSGVVDDKLGRAETEFRQGRSEDVQDILARRRANLEGLGRQEVQAERARAGQEINRQTEQQRRSLAAIQARTGVRGGVAAAQQAQALMAGAKTRADFERDLFLRNEQVKREALGAFEQSVGAAERDEFSRQAAGAELEKFNLGQQFRERGIQQQNLQARIEQERFDLSQQAREKFGQQAVSLGFAQLASGELSAEQAIQAQTAAAEASGGCFAPDTEIVMADGSRRRIEEISIGDETKYGIVYSLLVTQAPRCDMYGYEGVVVAGSHAVKENGEWVRVRESLRAVPAVYNGLLYNLGVKNHQLSANGVLFSDIDELDLVSEIDEMYLDGLNGVS